MTTPPPPPGQPGPGDHGNQPGPYGQQQPGGVYGQGGYGQGGYGQGAYGQDQQPFPYAQPPKKGGVPTWAWIVGGIIALFLLCGCGVLGLGVAGILDSDGPTDGPAVSSTTDSGPTTDEPTTDEPTTDEPTTDEPSSSTQVPGSSVPPTPAGTTPNTDSRNSLPSADVEGQVANGMSGYGHTKSDISCPQDLPLIKGEKTTCTAPIPGESSARSAVTVVVDWAVVDDNNQISYYLSFQQRLG